MQKQIISLNFPGNTEVLWVFGKNLEYFGRSSILTLPAKKILEVISQTFISFWNCPVVVNLTGPCCSLLFSY